MAAVAQQTLLLMSTVSCRYVAAAAGLLTSELLNLAQRTLNDRVSVHLLLGFDCCPHQVNACTRQLLQSHVCAKGLCHNKLPL